MTGRDAPRASYSHATRGTVLTLATETCGFLSERAVVL